MTLFLKRIGLTNLDSCVIKIISLILIIYFLIGMNYMRLSFPIILLAVIMVFLEFYFTLALFGFLFWVIVDWKYLILSKKIKNILGFMVTFFFYWTSNSLLFTIIEGQF
jgi:hypothetical protein